jgi:ketosteroid isomerase-like protein
MSEQSIATVQRMFDAVARRDAAGVFGAYHPNIVIHEAPSLPYGGEFRGFEGAARHAAGYSATWDRFQSATDRDLSPTFLAEGDQVVVRWRFRAHSMDGDAIDRPAVSLYRLHDGKIIESRMFHFDTATLLQFLERAEAQPQS